MGKFGDFEGAVLHELLDGMSEGVVVVDRRGRIVLFNRAAEALFGYAAGDVSGCDLSLLMPERSRLRHIEHVEQFASGSADRLLMTGRADVVSRRKDGSEFPVQVSLGRIHSDSETFFVAIVLDQTERRRRERTESSLAAVERAAHLGHWEWRVGSRIVVGSDELFRIVDRQAGPEQMTLEELFDSVHPDDSERLREVVQSIADSGGEREITHRVLRSDGAVRVVHHKLELAGGSGVDLPTVFGTIHDVTQKAGIERQLQQVQNLDSIATLTRGIAHDFNNILMVVLGNLELAGLDLKDRPETAVLLEEARGAGERALELIDRLRAFARQGEFQRSTVDLRKRTLDLETTLRQSVGPSIKLSIDVEDELWRCSTDAAQYELVLLNLATNARNAMPDGGTIQVELSNERVDPDAAVLIPKLEPGEYVLLTVSDSGPGIPEEYRSRVFDPFFTTNEPGGGAGLGLSMVYGFATQSHGHVVVSAAESGGACFGIYLPRVEEEETMSVVSAFESRASSV